MRISYGSRFQTSLERKVIGEFSTWDKVLKAVHIGISKACRRLGIKSYYRIYRQSSKDAIEVDFGSHMRFIYIENVPNSVMKSVFHQESSTVK